MKIVAWGNKWKAFPAEGPAKKFSTKAEAEAWADAMERGAQVAPGSRTIEVSVENVAVEDVIVEDETLEEES